MSELVKQAGTIIEIYSDIKGISNKFIKLASDIGADVDDIAYKEPGGTDYYWPVSDNYVVVDDRLFENHTHYEDPEGDYCGIRAVGNNTYEVDTAYYNGGASLSDMLREGFKKMSKVGEIHD